MPRSVLPPVTRTPAAGKGPKITEAYKARRARNAARAGRRKKPRLTDTTPI